MSIVRWRVGRRGGTVTLVVEPPDATVEAAVATLVRGYFCLSTSPWGNGARVSLTIGGAGYAHEGEGLWTARVQGALASFVAALLDRSDDAAADLRRSVRLRAVLIREFRRSRP